MLKLLWISLAAAALAGCGPKDSASDYKFTLAETESIVKVTRDEILTCKGAAIIGNAADAKTCYLQYIENNGENSRYKIATDDFFERIEAYNKRMNDPEYLRIVKIIDTVNDTSSYMLEYFNRK